MAAEDEVKQASDRFYAALNHLVHGDPGPMVEVWSHEPDVTTMHPLGGRQVGWEAVRTSWEQVAHIASSGQVSVTDLLIRVDGNLAYTLGVEHAEATFAGQTMSGETRATNIYRREGGRWKLVHHHTDIVPAFEEFGRRQRG